LYGKKVCSNLDSIRVHIEKHKLKLTPEEYIGIGDYLINTWFSSGGQEKEEYILSKNIENKYYLGIFRGRTEDGYWILRSLRRVKERQANEHIAVVQEMHPYRSGFHLLYPYPDNKPIFKSTGGK